MEHQIGCFSYPNPKDIRNLLDYPAERITSYIPDVEDIFEDQLSTQPEDEKDSQKLPKITIVDAQKSTRFA